MRNLVQTWEDVSKFTILVWIGVEIDAISEVKMSWSCCSWREIRINIVGMRIFKSWTLEGLANYPRRSKAKNKGDGYGKGKRWRWKNFEIERDREKNKSLETIDTCKTKKIK